MNAIITTNKGEMCAPGANIGSTTCTATPSRAGSSMIPSCSDEGKWNGKVRFSNTAPRFPIVLYQNLSVYGGLRGVFLAQPARPRAHARAHVRIRHARSPSGASHGAFSPSLDYHQR